MDFTTLVDSDRCRSSGEASQYLVVLGPAESATHLLPERGALLIGRADDAPICLKDPLASRSHARLHVGDGKVEIEDLGSANGTRVREVDLARGARVQLYSGESVAIGSTVLLLHSRAPAFAAHQVWPHSTFQSRLAQELARAKLTHATFSLLRVRLSSDADVVQARDPIAEALRPGDVLATFSPREYEVLLIGVDPAQSRATRDRIATALRARRIQARTAMACYPTDATSPHALVMHATAALANGGPPASSDTGTDSLIIESAAMRELYRVCDRVAASGINVLITGETGSGKEVLAQTIHRRSARAGKPFVAVNCAALSESLLESELFGHERGAFTGAVQPKPGLIESVEGGCLFLDEVGEMSLAMQAKLLRVLETRQVMRVGAIRPTAVDVRFIAATNRDLESEVACKRFRADLYFRLSGLVLEIPPLRERVEEIAALARLYLAEAARQLGRPAPALTPAALESLEDYEWPGNIRQLRNVIERAVLLCNGDRIEPSHLYLIRPRRAIADAAPDPRTPVPESISWRATRHAAERQAIVDALGRCAGSQTRAAELLGISRRTLCSRIKQLNIPRPQD